MLTVAEVKDFLRVDEDYDDELIKLLIGAADEYLAGAIGKNYDKNSSRVKVLKLFVIKDLYDGNELDGKVGSVAARRVADFVLQLQLEARS